MSDYGRDETGKYTGNPQPHDPVQLGGETQRSIGGFFGKWDDLDDGTLLVDLACRVALSTGITLTMIAARQSLYERQHQLMGGDPGACLAIQLARFAHSRGPGYDLSREAGKRMAQLRDAASPGPFEHKAAWKTDADARKGEAGA